MATVIQIQGNVPWRYLHTKGGNYVAICDPLKLTLQAKTFAELMEDVAISLDALLKDLVVTNEFDRFLREQGWTALAPVPIRMRNVRFDIPFAMIPAMAAHGQPTGVH